MLLLLLLQHSSLLAGGGTFLSLPVAAMQMAVKVMPVQPHRQTEVLRMLVQEFQEMTIKLWETCSCVVL